MSSEKRRRRWFRPRYSLATLFIVVTVFGCWLGWNINIVRQRAQMRERINAYREDTSPVGVISYDEFNRRKLWGPGERSPDLPLTLRLLGAEPEALIYAPEEHFSEQEVEQIERLFPEAVVIPWDPEKWEEAMEKMRAIPASSPR